MFLTLVASVLSKPSSHLFRIKNFAMGQLFQWTGLCITVTLHGQEQRAVPGTACVATCQNMLPNLKYHGSTCGSVLALGSTSCTDW